ncbi:hypothetical protein LTR78_007106 [Recurvomyces mirabilis]|uniref:Uncharacterized protein n=1 Tax=Recurvomyces mirabilis TaxID=574656 RepID=A0AAE0WJR5_9PEZI|nr:hypothetical protein LTR78_007106 [Recurvomyces mirabilis]KAK5150923.1 hypothetical protein LTS14_009726 [Recurvomyces mirabilis]
MIKDFRTNVDESHQRHIALELIQALVFRQDERVADLCRDHLAYSAFLSPEKMPSLDDTADSPAMRMKQLIGFDQDDHAAHGWSPISHTTLQDLLDARLRAYGTSTMCQQRIMGIMQKDNICAVRFRELNRLGALDKTSVIRMHFSGAKVDAIDEYVDARRSYGFERAVGVDDWSSAPSSPASIYSM